MKHMKHASETLAATPNLLLKHPGETFATYIQNSRNTQNIRMKHLQKKHLKTLHMSENICNIQMKHLQTYVWKNEMKHLGK
jgi:hypothetical protein